MHARADGPEHRPDHLRSDRLWADHVRRPPTTGQDAHPLHPGASGMTTMSARAALALQRAAGNRATGRLLSEMRSRVAAIPVVQRDDDGPTVTSPLRSTVKLLPAPRWLSDPAPFLRDRPTLAPQGGLPLLPPAGVEGLIDWGTVGAAYRDRKLTLEDRDRSLVIGHWQRWYPVAQAMYGLPLARSLFASPADIMNTMSAKMIDSSLAGDQPNVIEQFNRQAEQFGVKTTTVGVTIGHF